MGVNSTPLNKTGSSLNFIPPAHLPIHDAEVERDDVEEPKAQENDGHAATAVDPAERVGRGQDAARRQEERVPHGEDRKHVHRNHEQEDREPHHVPHGHQEAFREPRAEEIFVIVNVKFQGECNDELFAEVFVHLASSQVSATNGHVVDEFGLEAVVSLLHDLAVFSHVASKFGLAFLPVQSLGNAASLAEDWVEQHKENCSNHCG